MALDNESKSTEVTAVEDEKIKTAKEPQDDKLTEKIIVPMEEMNPKDVEPPVAEKTIPETDTNNESKEQIAGEVAEIIAKNVDDPVAVTENDPIVCEPQPIPADEIAMKKNAEMKEKKEEEEETKVIEPLKIEEPAVVSDHVKNDDEAAENSKSVESKENKETVESVKEKTDVEKPAALEDVKTESKEDKKVDEIKLTDSTPKEEDKTSPRESNSFMGKMKKSFWRAKKAISGKSSGTPTATTTKTSETKQDEKT